jgi:hypothetical protein
MTSVAKGPECTCVDVFGSVTAKACCPQLDFFLRRSLVARKTTESVMRSVEAKTRTSVVIEVPLAPVSGIVTLLTKRPQSPLVHIIFLMTRPALRAGIFEGCISVTILAWHVRVLAQQRKSAQTVIKEYLPFPGLFIVAAPTLFSFLTFMGIILFMTAKAGRLKTLLVKDTLMTSRAFCLPVFAAQGEFCMTVVVEGDAFPVPRRVTAVTLGAEAPLMAFLVIVILMTCVTVRFQFFFIERPLMAGRAFRESVFSC